MDNDDDDILISRINELQDTGLDAVHAFGRASLESRLSKWPAAWGNRLEFLLYGDFMPPDRAIDFPSLRITALPEKLTKTVIRGPLTVLRGCATVNDRSLESVFDVARRVNVLLGVWTLVTWGNSACGWWSWVVHGASVNGQRSPFENDGLHAAVEHVARLPERLREKIESAIFWMREPHAHAFETHHRDLFRRYAGLWNAFECLVDAVCIIKPPLKPSRGEKERAIAAYFCTCGSPPTVRDIEECYKQIVNPGLVGKASHAMRVCLGDQAESFIDECFRLPDKRQRLYDIRNLINHGEIDAENPDESSRIESRFHTLELLVLHIFGRLIPFPIPAFRKDE